MPTQHGIKVNELTTGARPIAAVATAVIGLVVTCDTADADAFPLDTPVLVTNIRDAQSLVGNEPTGTMKPALDAIADQVSPILIIVRVAEDADPDAQDLLVIGDIVDGKGTGLKALLEAQSTTGIRPRILGAPGLDTLDVTTEAVIIAKKLRAMVYARAIGVDAAAALVYKAGFSARELMLIWPGTDDAFAGDAVARALGLRSRIDEQQGWNKTLSNVAMDGVTGLEKPIDFDLVDDSTTAGALNAGNVTTIIRQNGYRFWGNRTCSDTPEFEFESAVRTSQVLQDEIAQGLFTFIDMPLNVQLVRDMLETINARFRSLKARGLIIDGVAEYRGENNSAVDLAAGKLVIDYEFTPTAPMEHLTLNQRITDRFYGNFAELLA
jgi:phage tail sheath protein FI